MKLDAALNQNKNEFDSEHHRSQQDRELVALVAELYEAHLTAIFTYIYGLVDDWQLAHDLTQETFLQLHQTRHRLPNVENHRAWVYRIAGHIALNERKRRRLFSWLPWGQMDKLNHTRVVSDFQMFEDEIGGQDMIGRALSQLRPGYRAPLLLYSVYEFRTTEIAEILGISVDAVKQRLRRAREQFRQVYDEGNENG